MTEDPDHKALIAANARADAAETAAADRAWQISYLAHELRTAIGGVNSMADLLSASQLDDAQHKQLEALRQSCKTLLSLVNNVLEDAKLRSGKMSVDPVETDLSSLVASLESGLAARAAFKGLQSAVSVDGPLPALVQVDLLRLQQVVDNLIDNAVKFTEKGGVQLRLSFEEGAEARGIMHLAVSDTGPGLARNEVDRLFTPFTQADSSVARRYGGSGLGLSIVKQLVELMGGSIEVSSEVGAGSTFSVNVPVTAVHWSSEQASPPHDATTRTIAAPVHVLVVEDNSVNQFLISTLLESFGMTFRIAGGGNQGIAAYECEAFDIVLMDIRMPVVDGIAAARAMRDLQKAGNFTPIVALTAQFSEDISQARREGLFDCHVAKPIDPAELAKAINAAMDRGRKAVSA